MELIVCSLLAIILILSVIAVVGIWRQPKPSLSSTPHFEQQLAHSERRIMEQVDRLRTSMNTAIRESSQSISQAQQELAVLLTSGIDRTRTETLEAITVSFQASHNALQQSLSGARRSQDERLDKVETALNGFTVVFSKAVADLNTNLINFTGEQREAQTASANMLGDTICKNVQDLSKQLTLSQADGRKELTATLQTQTQTLQAAREAQTNSFTALQDSLTKSLRDMRDTHFVACQELQDRMQKCLDEVRSDNAEKLEKIRATVEEKLDSTLETRLDESFRIVSDQLEKVYKGIGEMQSLAAGVGDLRRVLTNVRSRGTFGEIQLEALIEQVFVTEQYAKNITTVPGSNDRVEFAIKLPSRHEGWGQTYLPIDAKFPQEDFLRLQQAYEDADVPAIEECRKSLRRCILEEAKKIQEKYLAPPHTTDFALLFLPTEGLYAEVLRIPGLSQEVQTRFRVVPVGPNTLFAVFNSLQMAFRTVAIEKRSGEVWKILGAVKTEFGKFGKSLEDVSTKLQQASRKIDETATRTRVMQRQLKDVEILPETEIDNVLPHLEEDQVIVS
jgi:DNA recombination protein RmuC